MKKPRYLFILFSTALLSLGAYALQAAADGGNYTSTNTIEFKYSKDPEQPVDPSDPTKPIKPIDPTDPEHNGSEGTGGPLSIDYVSNLFFGKQEITLKDKLYYAAPQRYLTESNTEKKGPNFIQATDNRGESDGWAVYVKQNGQFISPDEDKLAGAELRFRNGNVVSSFPNLPEGNKTINLDPSGSASLVMRAKKGSGLGTFLLTWGKNKEQASSSIELFVPGKTPKKTSRYTTSLTWIMNDVPGN